MSNDTKITRRGFLGGSIVAAGLAAGAGILAPAGAMAAEKSKKAKRSFRFAHITDIHLTEKLNAPQGFAAALAHIQSQKDKPEMIITGGDHIMDSIWADDEKTEKLWTLFKDVMKKECRLPVKYCIGNHDCWGLAKKNSNTTGNEPNWGCKRAVEELELPGRYYSFDEGKWRFVVLDSVMPNEHVYTGYIDDEQFAWLEKEIQTADGKFICLFTHIPIMSAAAYFYGAYQENDKWIIPCSRVIANAEKLKDLFWKNKNVKLCISGHIHLKEHIDYNGVSYISDGAISGSWWKGVHKETEEGYGLFDLYDDGTFDYQYVDYGWQVKGV
jgi:3',5'-cyclic AMP phosphodiesterase CpdA